MKPFPQLQTNNFLLRQINDGDLNHIFQALSDPRVNQFYGVRFDSLEDTKTQIEWFKELEVNDLGIWWAICDKESNEFFGACGFNNLNREHQKVEVGFWLLPEYWGKGIIGNALPRIVSYAFGEMNVHRIEAFVETGNDNSKKVLTKLGFEHEGTMKDCERKNGAFISLDIFSKLVD